MIGNDLEIEIIELFRQDITILLSINQIATKLGKTYPYIHKKTTSFIKSRIFNETKIGTSTLCSINLQSEEALILLSINEVKKKKDLLKKSPKINNEVLKIKELAAEIPIRTALYSQGKIFLVTDNPLYKKMLANEFSNSKVFTKNEFKESILNDISLIQAHTLLYHNEKYYEILGEIENELRIKNSPMTKKS